ncbi:hypothetical protein FPQ18DRAFT_310017 [Pyronema domesticum]|nr:hypothetical protein FPQ18DRAFT_310017 [Pyronema domesticum]
MNYPSAIFLGAHPPPAWMGHRTIPFVHGVPRHRSTSSPGRHVRFVEPPAAHPRPSHHSSWGNSAHQNSHGPSSTAANYGGSVRGGPLARHESSHHSRGHSSEVPSSTAANYGGSVRGGPSAACRSSRNSTEASSTAANYGGSVYGGPSARRSSGHSSRHSRAEPAPPARRSRGHSPMPVVHGRSFSTVRMPRSRNRAACRYEYEFEEVEQVTRQYFAPRR